MSFRATATIWASTALMAIATKPMAFSLAGIGLVVANVAVTYAAYYIGRKGE